MGEPIQLGTVIAKRVLEYHDPDGGTRAVEVLLGAPVESAAGMDWCCPWQVIGVGSEQVRAAYGIDAFHSLQLSMIMIGATLYAVSSRLTWMGGAVGDLGFPTE